MVASGSKLPSLSFGRQLVNQYDVFVSSCGIDMLSGFADELRHRLMRAGICAFNHKKHILAGEELEVSVTEAIDHPKISILIISQLFLSSEICLQELTYMLRRRDRRGHVVLPIFYYISPSQIKDHAKSSLRKWEDKLDWKTLEEWKTALLEITRTKGYTLSRCGISSWNQIFLEVVEDVQRLLITRENYAKLVGTDYSMEEMMGKLGVVFRDGQAVELRGEDVRMIGIYGMPGVGKTTLAKAVFHKIHHLFDCCSFLKDVHENTERGWLISLQEQLISDLEKQDREKLSSCAQGIEILKYSFCGERVLILLDDVHNSKEIKPFVGVPNCFGPGSRIILTSRSQNVLDFKDTLNEKLEVQPLGNFQALTLLRRHAFPGRPYPGHDGYDSALFSICRDLGGLPLAIEIAGSFLSKNQWEEMVDKLKASGDEVKAAVEVSYQKLGESTKAIFLDVAYFFIGKDARIASYMWHACGYNPFDGIAHLRRLSLVKIEEDNELWMHDEVRDFGREISQKPSIRFWKRKDSLSALRERKVGGGIEALDFRTDGESVEILTSEEFHDLSKLRFLSLGNSIIRGNFKGLLSNLMWLDWQGCPETFQAVNLDLNKLVILDLSWSKVTEDWKGWREIKMGGLKVLNLTGCTDMLITPDFSGYPKLEILILAHCSQLVKVHSSICELKCLLCLNLEYCNGLNMLPKELGNMGALEKLLIDGTSIKEIPDMSKMNRLKKLSASNCSFLSMVPSVDHLEALKVLSLANANIIELPESVKNVRLLQKLLLRDCGQLRKLPRSIGELIFLSELDVSGTGISDLPDSITNLQNLKVLRLDYCHIKMFPYDIGRLNFLEEIHASGCRSLKQLPHSIGKLSRLRILRLQYSRISSIPSEIHTLSSLETFDLPHCDMQEKLPKHRPSSSKSQLASHYDVFLSFEGSDVHPPFIDALYDRLIDEGFSVFRDREIFVGEGIQPNPLKAIKRSEISVPIISPHYASSKWCLMELAQMLDCSWRKGHKIIPIFYNISPSDIRGNGFFNLTWEEHVKRGTGTDTIHSWRKALLEICNVKVPILRDLPRNEGTRTVEDHVPSWRKYRLKILSVARFLSIYFSCQKRYSTRQAKKQVQRLHDDPFTFEVANKYDLRSHMPPTTSSIPPPTRSRLTVTLPPWETLMRRSRLTLPPVRPSGTRNQGEERTIRVAVPRMGNTEIPPEDGYTWRKYGQKEILGSSFPRSYYRCTGQMLYECLAKKEVQRLDDDPFTFEVTYRYNHTCRISSTTPSIPPPPPSQPPTSTSTVSSQEVLIRKVVDAVIKLLEKPVLPVTDKLVGIDAHVEEIMRKLGILYRDGRPIEMRDDGICAVGICGMPGIGKTTLAKVVYNKINHLFQACSFVGGIREGSTRGELMSLKEELSNDLSCAYRDSDSIYRGQKRVLIVLDDVHNCEEVKALAVGNSGFGPGSRIMVTTRKRNALNSLEGGEVKIYDIEPMARNLALNLFYKHALKGNPQRATEEVQTLSKHIIEVIGGLPLAIEVVGSQLYGRSADKWKATLDKLSRRPAQATVEVFRKTFDCLDFMEQQIFLDIACFFSGKDQRILYCMWDACGYYPRDSLNLLCELSLVKIGEHNKVCMHDELQKFGKEIVRNEDPKQPWRRSRLWRHEDAKIMLKHVKGNENVKAVALEYENNSDSFTEEQFSGLSNLRFLRLGNIDIEGNFGRHLPNLKWLEWQGCPNEAIELWNLNLENLVILDLSRSRVTEQWRGWKWIIEKAKALKVLKLTSCIELAKSPDITAPMKVERLDLESCCQLLEILPSVGNLESLVSLNVKHCKLIVQLPELSSLKALEELLIDGTSINEIFIPEGSLPKLKVLTARQCKRLRHIPESIGHLISLTYLAMDGATEIEEIPESVSSLENLQTLSLRDCGKVSSLPDDIGRIKSLQSMDLSGTSIIELPFSLWDLENLKVLKMVQTTLREFPLRIINLKKLEEIDFSYCWHLEGEIPSGIIQLCCLRILKLSFTRICSLPESICELFNLKFLDLHGCENLATLPSFPSNINVVY